ncbi:hypothetical protein TTHERM_00320010 (macronuclear) [Tetrahymena thermophila SB210]|uniref:Uncharacterized protein n=1 Tax=Tetrahymena thermophila (strain SB210) TaxID=312017 RepID=Q237T4_TETTS|nr:hypothetical protein TTHERM_00320010 [Tetrahymena thermophila SB210]EAR92657.4 hypothetical protein TTHERM_00320010 [Tetrahymena thermophila SB210]|eukprot:XP_001012902.4 hypothetical protein TTHERM_00320010 [Tetrahymena thermophila SB210]
MKTGVMMVQTSNKILYLTKFIEKRLNNPAIFKLKSDNENITHDQFDHDGSNFQQDFSIKQLIEKKLKDRANLKLKFLSNNKNITHGQFDHYRQNFKKNYSNQQQSSNYNNNQTSIQLRITQENQNSTVTDENWGHDGSNFQQDSLLNQFIEKRLKNAAIFKLKSDNENITHDQFDHDGSNFQQDSSIKQFIEKKLKDRANLKLKFLSDNKNNTHDQFDHNGSNFKQDFYKVNLQKQKNENQTITNDNWNHDGQNFQHYSLDKQKNYFENHKKNILTIASQPEDGKNLPYLSKEVTIYKNKIFSQIIELRIAQNIYQEYTKFIYNLYINNQQHSQIHEIVMNTNSILSCTAQSQPQKQQAIQKNIEIINSVFGILNIPLKYEFNFLIDHSYEIIPQDSKCDISFLTQVKVQVDSHEGLQIIGQNENGFRVNGLLINEICLFNFTVDTQQLSISSEINKQQGEIRYSVGQYYRKQICDQKFSSIQIQDVTKQLRKSLQTPFETKCHLSDMQDDEQNQTTFVNKGQDESAINLTKQIDFIKFN